MKEYMDMERFMNDFVLKFLVSEIFFNLKTETLILCTSRKHWPFRFKYLPVICYREIKRHNLSRIELCQKIRFSLNQRFIEIKTTVVYRCSIVKHIFSEIISNILNSSHKNKYAQEVYLLRPTTSLEDDGCSPLWLSRNFHKINFFVANWVNRTYGVTLVAFHLNVVIS